MKKGLFLILMFGLILFLCAGCNNDEESSVSSDMSSSSNNEDTLSSSNNEDNSTDSEGFQEFYDEVKSTAEESLVGYEYFDMSYDEDSNTVTMQFAIDGLADALLYQADSIASDWEDLKEMYIEMSDTLYNKFENNGYDVDVVVVILNDENHDNVFFGVLNGVEVYDYFGADE